jgi:filamentous hemagglutinin family protein
MRALHAAVCLLATVAAVPAGADLVTDGTVGPRVRLGGDFEVRAELGRRAGRNLFHSFKRFSLDAGERATFSGPDSIRNVISRVTGGARSDIDGTIRSTIPGADFYFINPAGVVFGPNASLDLEGSFHVSTADELRFEGGATFSASEPAASSFSVAAPEAFGFLGSSPKPILVDRGTLEVRPGRALSIVGGEVDLSGGALSAAAGEVNLLALGGRGTARVAGNVGARGERADVALRNQSRIETTGDGGGRITIRGEAIVVDGGSTAFADNSGPSDGRGGITLGGRRLALRAGSLLTADVVGEGTGQGGAVAVRAAEVAITGGSRLAADTFATGNAGRVTVAAGDLVLRGGFIRSASEGAGDAGTVTIRADRATLLEGAQFISSPLGESTGAGGEVRVTVRDALLIAGRDAGGIPSGIFAIAEGDVDSEQDAGDVTVSAGSLAITGGAVVTSSTLAAGNAGEVTVSASELVIADQGKISSNTFGAGNAGRVTVDAERLLIDGGGFSAGTASSTGILSEAQVLVTDGQVVVAEGDAGRVTVGAGALEIRNAGRISSLTLGAGDAGVVTVEADRLLIDGQGSPSTTGIVSDASRLVASTGQVVVASGAGGAVAVTAGDLQIRDGATISSTTFGPSNAGTVEVVAQALTMSNFSFIRSEATSDVLSTGETIISDADSAGVTITSDTITMTGSSQITSSVAGDGNAGPITVTSTRIDMAGDDGNLATGILSEAAAIAFADTGEVISLSDGNAGRVAVVADDIRIRDAARISTNVVGRGQAGKVLVHGGNITIENAGRLAEDTGIVSDASNTVRGDGTVIASSDGTAGNVTVAADRVEVGAFGEIASSTVGAGNSGSVEVRAPLVIVRDGGQISTRAVGAGEAGRVAVRAPDRLLLDGGSISTESALAGGGEIRLLVGDVIDVHDSEVETSVAGGEDPTAGNVIIDPRILIIDGSRIQANARGAPRGAGGEITIVADNILVPGGDFQALVDRGDISATGGPAGVDGTIVVDAPEVDLAGGLVVLEGALLDAASQLRERCGARRDVGASSFTGVGRGGLPPSPDGPLASVHLGAAPSSGGPVALASMATESAHREASAPCLGAP